jgi:hypothetical protein
LVIYDEIAASSKKMKECRLEFGDTETEAEKIANYSAARLDQERLLARLE